MELGYSRRNDTMNIGQYRDTKDMERVMLRNLHLYSNVSCKSADEIDLEERIEKIKMLRKKIMKKRKSKSILQKVKDLLNRVVFLFNI